jgi:fatty-acyl-CoA synthase
VQLRIVDAQMNDVAHDGVSQGEVVVRSPWLTQGYLGEPERSEELWRDGWLHTGDVGVIDADGYLKVVDRIKDVVKTGGEWVSSLDIEDIILRLPGVAEAAVVGVPDDRWGERPVAFVVGKKEATPSEDAFAATLPTSPVAARSRSTQCPTRSTSWTRFRRPASGSSTRK